jgi:hypothetical protein
MSLSIFDLIFLGACYIFGFFAAPAVAQFAGYAKLSGFALFILVCSLTAIPYLSIIQYLYWRCRLRPLFFPKCPRCKKRPEQYGIEERHWPRWVVVCGQCQNKTELWWRRPADNDLSMTMPSLLLCWPQSIGRWRPVVKRVSPPAPERGQAD